MQILQPLFLLALLTLPIIVVLHIVRQRKRRVAVPSLLLWRDIPRKPEGKRLNRLPITWLLLLHLVAAALLAFALARPQLSGLLRSTPSHTVLVIDTSTSMGAGQGTTRLEQARQEARAVVRSLRGSDHVSLIAMGPQARLVDAGGPEDLTRLLASLDGLSPGGSGSNLGEALTLAEATLQPDQASQVLILSDGSLGPAPVTLGDRTLSAPVAWQTVGASTDNRAIVAFAARPWSSDSRVQLYARVANFSDSPELVSLRLLADGQTIDTRQVALNPNGQSEQVWTLPAQRGRIEAQIDGGDALAADDTAVLQLAPRRVVEAVLVSDAPEVLARALEALPELQLRVVEPASYTPAPADLTIFDGIAPPASLPAGGVLLIAPPAGEGLLSAQTPVALPAAELRAQGPLVDGLSLGGIDFGPVSRIALPTWAEEIVLAADPQPGASDDDIPLIVRGRSGQSEVAVWSFGLRAGNLRARLAFPLLVARTVRALTPQPLPASLPAGATLAVQPSPRATSVELSGPDGQTISRTIAARIALGPLSQPGIYTLREQSDEGALYEGFVAVNAGAAVESDLRAQQQPDIASGEPAAGQAVTQENGRELWPWLAALTIAILLGEWAYAQRGKKAKGERLGARG